VDDVDDVYRCVSRSTVIRLTEYQVFVFAKSLQQGPTIYS
jgi:hypothetical protein